MKKLLLLLFLPFTLCAQSYDAQLGDMLKGNELREKFAEPPSRLQLKYGSTAGKFSFFDVKNKIAYQGFSTGAGKALHIGEFKDYVNFSETRFLTSEMEVSENQKVFIHGFVSASNKFYVLYSVSDKEKNKEFVYVNELSSKMKALGTPLLLTTFDEKKSYSSPIYFTSSPDKKSYAIVREYTDRGAADRIEVKAFSQHFAELYKTSIDVASMEDHLVLTDVAIGNDRRLYLYGQVDPRAKRLIVMAGAKNKAIPLVMTYDSKSQKIKQVQVGEPGIKEYYDSRFFLTPDNEPVVVSVYNAGRKVGYRVSHLEKGMSYSGLLTPTSEKLAKKYGGKGLFLTVKNLQRLHSGEYIFSLECNFIKTTKYSSYPVSGPVIFVGLNQQLDRLWENTLYKGQLTRDGRANSHRSFATSSGLLVIYNENFENLSLEPSGAKAGNLIKQQQAMPVALEINASGEMKRYPLFKEQDMLGFTLDMNHFIEIEKGQYQLRIFRDPRLKQYETAYGKLELN